MSRVALLLYAILVFLCPVATGQLVLGKPPVFPNSFGEKIVALECEFLSLFSFFFNYQVAAEVIRLKCDDAELAEQYEWRIGDAAGPMISQGRLAELSVARDDYEKKYRCVARNTVGASLSPATTVLAKCMFFLSSPHFRLVETDSFDLIEVVSRTRFD